MTPREFVTARLAELRALAEALADSCGEPQGWYAEDVLAATLDGHDTPLTAGAMNEARFIAAHSPSLMAGVWAGQIAEVERHGMMLDGQEHPSCPRCFTDGLTCPFVARLAASLGYGTGGGESGASHTDLFGVSVTDALAASPAPQGAPPAHDGGELIDEFCQVYTVNPASAAGLAWGWQCFRCPAESLGRLSLAEAEAGRDQHIGLHRSAAAGEAHAPANDEGEPGLAPGEAVLVVQGSIEDRPDVFREACAAGASHVVFLPDGADWLRQRLHQAPPPPPAVPEAPAPGPQPTSCQWCRIAQASLASAGAPAEQVAATGCTGHVPPSAEAATPHAEGDPGWVRCESRNGRFRCAQMAGHAGTTHGIPGFAAWQDRSPSPTAAPETTLSARETFVTGFAAGDAALSLVTAGRVCKCGRPFPTAPGGEGDRHATHTCTRCGKTGTDEFEQWQQIQPDGAVVCDDCADAIERGEPVAPPVTAPAQGGDG